MTPPEKPPRRPFEPVGDQARWRTVYELLCGLDVNDVITHEQIASALGLTLPGDYPKIPQAIRRAAREYEVTNNRVLESVRGTGYRVVAPEEHLTLARYDQQKAVRALARGHSKVVHVDFENMDPATRDAFQVVASGFARQLDINNRSARRQRQMEDSIKAIVADRHRTDEEMAEMRLRLARVERLLAGGGL
jgi:hypothetical protein